MKPILFVLAILVSTGAIAHAGDSCRSVGAPTSWEALPKKAQERFPGGSGLHPKKWTNLTVSVYIARAPHLATQILTECGGVTVATSDAADQRHFSSMLTISVTSWSTLARIAQLPAVMSVSAYDRTAVRIKHPLPRPTSQHAMIDFD